MNADLVDTKVLLLGYTGYIGTTLAEVLLEKKNSDYLPNTKQKKS